jgi:hypothetical protein
LGRKVNTMKTTILGLGVVLFLVGCGGGSSGASAPTVHSLDSGNKRSAQGTASPFGPYVLPEGATVTYDIVDMPTGIGSDSMDTVIATDSDVRAGQLPIQGYAARTGISSTGATTPPLPADSYALVVVCNNTIDDCFFGATVTATY